MELIKIPSKYEAEFKKGDIISAYLSCCPTDEDDNIDYNCIVLKSLSKNSKISDFNFYDDCVFEEFYENWVCVLDTAEMIGMILDNHIYYICLYGDQKVLVESEYPETEHRIIGGIVTN